MNLEDLLIDQLKDLYSAEKQLLKALSKMTKKAKKLRPTKN
jgi:ferritin-like metal-binding protein YciE